MKKHLTKLISVCVVFALLLSFAIVPASAITWDNVEETNYADRYTSSYYTYGKYYSNLLKIPLTGDGARDVVAVAASQMGYLEGSSSSGQDGETGGSSNYTEYGAYTNVNGAAWCASFCSWCIYAAEVTNTRGTETYMARNGYYWSECYVPYWSNFLYDNGRYRFSDYYRSSYDYTQASYKPQPGDLIFFTGGYEPLDEGHIGLVAFSDSSYVYTLEGNTSSADGVEAEGGGAFFKKYSLSSSSIAGYGILPYATRSDLPEIDYTGTNPTPGLYVTTNTGTDVYFLRDDTTASWWLPASSVFEVSKIEKDNLGYTMLYSKCEIDGEIVNGWICLGNTSNGLPRTFQIYAAPEKSGIESDVYEITDNDVVKGISIGTTVHNFVSNVTTEGSIKVYDKNGVALSNTNNLGTGSTVQVLDGNEVIKTYTLVVKGDVNGDAKINGLDYIKVKRHILKTNKLEGVYEEAGMLNRVGKVTAYDYITIKRHVLGTYTIR